MIGSEYPSAQLEQVWVLLPAARRGQDMVRAVCLLRSYRRTFSSKENIKMTKALFWNRPWIWSGTRCEESYKLTSMRKIGIFRIDYFVSQNWQQPNWTNFATIATDMTTLPPDWGNLEAISIQLKYKFTGDWGVLFFYVCFIIFQWTAVLP